MKKKILLTMVLAFSLFLSACGSTKDILSPTAGTFTSLEPLSFDWGNINIAGGNVTKTFTLRNDEKQPLLLTGAVTSCMCTTAVFNLQDGSKSPAFGMQGGEEWSYEVQPEESFEVTVIYDPMAHGPTATGQIIRTVNVISKPDVNGKGIVYTRIDVKGNVLSESDYQAL
ncbi:MAG: DUF1573 domain-containing protein [Candidatus Altimarinota bacterium]|jgi:hypothetical protein